MSAPLPGPSVRMNLTGRVGQDCADAGTPVNSGVNRTASMNAQNLLRTPAIGFLQS